MDTFKQEEEGSKHCSKEGHWKVQEKRSCNLDPVPTLGVSQATCCLQSRFFLVCSGHGTSSWALYHTPQPSLELRWRDAPDLPLPYPRHDVPHAWLTELASLRPCSSSPEKANAGTATDADVSFPRGNAISTARACVPALCVITSHALSFS